MKFEEIGEFKFIEKIKRHILTYRKNNILKGIDDDCSVFKVPGAKKLNVITTDALIENVHFIRDKISPEDLGYKSLAVNLSDISAMGATPLDVYICLCIPKDIDVDFFDRFYQGIRILLNKYNLNLLGGDTSSSKSDLFITITVFGEVDEQNVIYRNGAKPGDDIFVTGNLGDSAGGLEILLNDCSISTKDKNYLINCHNHPKLYITESEFLTKNLHPNAMIDISDGLSSDLLHITSQSKVGAIIFEEKLPISDSLKKLSTKSGTDPLSYVFNGGEDYKLLFTTPKKYSEQTIKYYWQKFKLPLFKIGVITKNKKVISVSQTGDVKKILRKGWNHFKM